MKFTLRRQGESRSWPGYLFGRMRTSTVVLLIAFFATWWTYYTYRPVPAPEAPVTQVVPPGFVPDPAYTWVPRTNVEVPPETTTAPTTTETTATTEPTETTDTTAPDGTTTPATPTDTTEPTPTPAPNPLFPAPPTTPTTTVVPGPTPEPTTPPGAQ